MPDTRPYREMGMTGGKRTPNWIVEQTVALEI